MYTVYSKPNCTFCDQAKQLLNSKGLEYEEFIIDVGQPKDESKSYVTAAYLKELVPTARTVPQIFKDDVLIGGFVELRNSLSNATA